MSQNLSTEPVWLERSEKIQSLATAHFPNLQLYFDNERDDVDRLIQFLDGENAEPKQPDKIAIKIVGGAVDNHNAPAPATLPGRYLTQLGIDSIVPEKDGQVAKFALYLPAEDRDQLRAKKSQSQQE